MVWKANREAVIIDPVDFLRRRHAGSFGGVEIASGRSGWAADLRRESRARRRAETPARDTPAERRVQSCNLCLTALAVR